jgi:hypothetical protein
MDDVVECLIENVAGLLGQLTRSEAPCSGTASGVKLTNFAMVPEGGELP